MLFLTWTCWLFVVVELLKVERRESRVEICAQETSEDITTNLQLATTADLLVFRQIQSIK